MLLSNILQNKTTFNNKRHFTAESSCSSDLAPTVLRFNQVVSDYGELKPTTLWLPPVVSYKRFCKTGQVAAEGRPKYTFISVVFVLLFS
jgi:hypothetical protein